MDWYDERGKQMTVFGKEVKDVYKLRNRIEKLMLRKKAEMVKLQVAVGLPNPEEAEGWVTIDGEFFEQIDSGGLNDSDSLTAIKPGLLEEDDEAVIYEQLTGLEAKEERYCLAIGKARIFSPSLEKLHDIDDNLSGWRRVRRSFVRRRG